MSPAVPEATSVDPEGLGWDPTQLGMWVAVCQSCQRRTAGLPGWKGASSRGGHAVIWCVCLLFVCSRRDLEIERPMPGAHTVTLQ